MRRMSLIVGALVLGIPFQVAASALKWSVALTGGTKVAVTVDTTGLASNAVVGEASFRIVFYDNQNHEIGPLGQLFVDSQLPVLTAGHVYQRVYRHSYSTAETVQGVQLAYKYGPAGGKADDGTSEKVGPSDLNRGPDRVIDNVFREEGSLIKGSAPVIYLVIDGARRRIPDPTTFNVLGLDWRAVMTVSDAQLDSIPNGATYPPLRGRLVRGQGPATYLLENGTRRWIINMDVFRRHGFQLRDVQVIPDEALESIPSGRNLTD